MTKWELAGILVLAVGFIYVKLDQVLEQLRITNNWLEAIRQGQRDAADRFKPPSDW